MRWLRGVTFIEIVLVIALIAVVAAFSAPLYLNTQIKSDLDVAAQTAAQTMRRAQALSQGSDGDTTWGVKVGGGAVTLFKGATYAGRDASYDETSPFPASLAASGLSEVVFAKFTGLPSATGTLTITAVQINQSKTVTVNALGAVSY